MATYTSTWSRRKTPKSGEKRAAKKRGKKVQSRKAKKYQGLTSGSPLRSEKNTAQKIHQTNKG